jgi:hypothetical protein
VRVMSARGGDCDDVRAVAALAHRLTSHTEASANLDRLVASRVPDVVATPPTQTSATNAATAANVPTAASGDMTSPTTARAEPGVALKSTSSSAAAASAVNVSSTGKSVSLLAQLAQLQHGDASQPHTAAATALRLSTTSETTLRNGKVRALCV